MQMSFSVQQLMEAKAKLRKEEEAAKEVKDIKKITSDSGESSSTSTPTSEKKVESSSDAAEILPPGTESPTQAPAPTPVAVEPQITQITVNLKEREALLVGK